ncbi:MAG: single-stranded-DNA-specific exonuclease RecJ [Vampirovibrionales bacterium]
MVMPSLFEPLATAMPLATPSVSNTPLDATFTEAVKMPSKKTVQGMLGGLWGFKEDPLSMTDTLPDHPPWQGLLSSTHHDALLAKLLYARGVHTPEEAQRWLNPEQFDAFYTKQDPKALTAWALPDADLAIERIIQALETQETIVVYGDFDVDGVTGTAIFVETLQALKAHVHWYIPDRLSESHGLNAKALVKLVALQKPKLLITTDTGIMNHKEIQLLKNLKVDTIVTDHHGLPEEMPPAVACVNPRRLEDASHPLKHLCGAGTAYKVCVALIEQLKPKGYKKLIEKLADLAAIGTVADLVPLVGENRRIVQRGLPAIATRKRFGLKCLLEKAGLTATTPITSETIGFVIGPRVNAMGRLDHAEGAVRLMLTEDAQEAHVITETMEALNRERQTLCETTALEAEAALTRYWEDQPTALRHRVIVLEQPDWHPGVIGIVASRLVDRYHMPVFLMAQDSETGHWRGSARSIHGFSVSDALEQCQAFLEHYGGHAGAGGWKCTPEHKEAFVQALQAYAMKALTPEQCVKHLKADCTLTAEDISPELLQRIETLAPFGMQNPEPRFWTAPFKVLKSAKFGKEKKHLKLTLETDQGCLEAIMWKYPDLPLPQVGTLVEGIGHLEANHYPDAPPFRLQLKDWRTTGTTEAETPYASEKPSTMRAAVSESKTIETPQPSHPTLTPFAPPPLVAPVLHPPSLPSFVAPAVGTVPTLPTLPTLPVGSSLAVATTQPQECLSEAVLQASERTPLHPTHPTPVAETPYAEPFKTEEEVLTEAHSVALLDDIPEEATHHLPEAVPHTTEESLVDVAQAHDAPTTPSDLLPYVTPPDTLVLRTAERTHSVEEPSQDAFPSFKFIDHRGRMPAHLQDTLGWQAYWERLVQWQTLQHSHPAYANVQTTSGHGSPYVVYHEGGQLPSALFPQTQRHEWLGCITPRPAFEFHQDLSSTAHAPSSPSVMPSVLILWDIPPSFTALQALLQYHQPTWVHLIPAKPQVYYPAVSFLATLLKMLHKPQLASLIGAIPHDCQHASWHRAIHALASKLATTPQVIAQTLQLLHHMEVFQPATPTGYHTLNLEVLTSWQAMTEDDLQDTLMTLTPWGLASLELSLKEISQWRQTLLHQASYAQWQGLLKRS